MSKNNWIFQFLLVSSFYFSCESSEEEVVINQKIDEIENVKSLYSSENIKTNWNIVEWYFDLSEDDPDVVATFGLSEENSSNDDYPEIGSLRIVKLRNVQKPYLMMLTSIKDTKASLKYKQYDYPGGIFCTMLGLNEPLLMNSWDEEVAINNLMFFHSLNAEFIDDYNFAYHLELTYKQKIGSHKTKEKTITRYFDNKSRIKKKPK